LIEDDETFLWIGTADFIFQFDDLSQLGVNESSFTLDEFLSLFSSRIKEPGIDFGLFVFQRHVHRQDKGIFNSFDHIWMTCAVVEDETFDELCFGAHTMLHLHDFNHI
jgi:hypothetical protein